MPGRDGQDGAPGIGGALGGPGSDGIPGYCLPEVSAYVSSTKHLQFNHIEFRALLEWQDLLVVPERGEPQEPLDRVRSAIDSYCVLLLFSHVLIIRSGSSRHPRSAGFRWCFGSRWFPGRARCSGSSGGSYCPRTCSIRTSWGRYSTVKHYVGDSLCS